MKKIAITQRLIENTSYHEIRDALDVKWGKLLSELGFIPVILPTEFDFKHIFENIEIDGILLTGGNDLSCIDNNPLNKQRDAFEKNLIKYAIDKSIPLFGICRGLQIIADYFSSSFKKVENHSNVKHSLNISSASKYYENLKNINIVNSYHNYAVNEINDEFITSAFSEDGIIEAIEHKKYKIFGQMWHPEREESFNDKELSLIKKFFND